MPVKGRRPKAMTTSPRRSQHDWIEVTYEPFTGAPRLPRTRPNGQLWPEHIRRRWRAWSTMPHCCLWLPSDWTFAIDTLEVAALWIATGKTAYATELRYREKVMGTTRDSLLGLRIRYVAPKLATVHAVTPTAPDDFRDL
jgi:hypothetical protein